MAGRAGAAGRAARQPGDLVLTLGAGDVTLIGPDLVLATRCCPRARPRSSPLRWSTRVSADGRARARLARGPPAVRAPAVAGALAWLVAVVDRLALCSSWPRWSSGWSSSRPLLAVAGRPGERRGHGAGGSDPCRPRRRRSARRWRGSTSVRSQTGWRRSRRSWTRDGHPRLAGQRRDRRHRARAGGRRSPTAAGFVADRRDRASCSGLPRPRRPACRWSSRAGTRRDALTRPLVTVSARPAGTSRPRSAIVERYAGRRSVSTSPRGATRHLGERRRVRAKAAGARRAAGRKAPASTTSRRPTCPVTDDGADQR